MSRQDAEAYVGGRTVLDALEREYPETIKPVYQSTRLRVYRREDLDKALGAARLRDEPLTP